MFSLLLNGVIIKFLKSFSDFYHYLEQTENIIVIGLECQRCPYRITYSRTMT